MRLLNACRLFLRALREPDFATRQLAPVPVPASLPAPMPTAARSEAIELLAVMQREGRLVDFLQEPIATYEDAQIGAAVREVHAGCQRALERIFGPVPVMSQTEGSRVQIPIGYDPSGIKLTGAVTGAPPYAGTLQHAGWRASRCILPTWTGSEAAAMLIAPPEVDVR